MTDLEIAVEAAREGAAIVLEHFSGGRTADLKGTNNPVTEADRLSEARIVEVILSHRPTDGILAEEGTGSASHGRRWIIDPLDGTVNFVHGIPHMGVAVALFEGDRGLAGVVVDPFRGEVFAAASGSGATLGGTAIAVSARRDVSGCVVATGFPYDHDVRARLYAAVVEEALRRVNGIRRFGSSALDLCWVGCGRLDGYWELGLAPWDIAAGLVIAREAGATVTDPDGIPSTTATPWLVASNGHIHSELREIVTTGIRNAQGSAPQQAGDLE
jgi:myo-inositol-1(or 4)-monophosphatase